jgi:hypothetical protein
LNRNFPPQLQHIAPAVTQGKYLMHEDGRRVVIASLVRLYFDEILHGLRPLYDEHSMLFTSDTRAKPALCVNENFGTFADQLIYEHCPNSSWRDIAETYRDPGVLDKPLDFIEIGIRGITRESTED